MLDNCSQGTFVKEEIIEALGVDGRSTSVTIKTLNGEMSQRAIAVEGLKVAGSMMKTTTTDWINLPRSFTKESFSVEEQEIATPTKVKDWDYLKGIVDNICPNTNISVGLLIGANFAEALEPKEVI